LCVPDVGPWLLALWIMPSMYMEYVPRHIFHDMCPSALCGDAALST
jgi:hypothetical protein